MTGLLVIPGWEGERYFGDLADLLYEDAIRKCRKYGHDLDAMVTDDGLEAFACRRCDTAWEEVR